ncbi:DUF4177 domain-containing protein [Clostridium scatologenes]|nr:DUF4177 domain-containing protein [Clostridium scatologenes]
MEDFNFKLNELGNEGWELVSCVPISGTSGETVEVTAVFKRKK